MSGVACSACGIKLAMGNNGWVHIAVGSAEVLVVLKCPAYAKAAPAPYSVADRSDIWMEEHWTRLWDEASK
jgi:hypothetical protein